MIGAFESWSRIMAASVASMTTGMKMLETSQASSRVIAARTDMISAAFTSPLTANHLELSRMVPEKVEAFSRAGTSISNIWWGMSAAWMSQSQQITALAMRGRLPTAIDLAALHGSATAHALAMMDASVDMGTKSLAPIHRAATANAVRLAKTGSKKKRRTNG